MKETQLVVAMDDLDFGVKDVFETKALNRYGIFDRIVNRSMEDPSYAYLHYNLLNKAVLTTITLRGKSPHIDIHE